MFQPKESMRCGSIPPSTGSSVDKQHKGLTIQITVDTTEIDKALEKLREMERIYDKIHDSP
jgi:formate dehydrogenase assembly factor FdhD